MPKFKVEYIEKLTRQPEIVEADDVAAVSDYTVQFMDTAGRTKRIIGGIQNVTLVEDELPKSELRQAQLEKFAADLTVTNTQREPTAVPASPLAEPPSGGWPEVGQPVEESSGQSKLEMQE